MISSYYKSLSRDFTLLHGDCVDLLSQFRFRFDMIFADPPYFLSNGGITCHAGKVACVDKGIWDRSWGDEYVNEFNLKWILACRDKLKEDGTIWISGTYHNIFSVFHTLKTAGFQILNVVTWVTSNPPPNISCRYFTYSTEFLVWARKNPKVPHYFNYELMKRINGDKQMPDVWRLPSIAPWEKTHGKHPTQKPLPLLSRIIMASTRENAWILDSFCGSSTTGIAAALLNRRYLGIDKEEEFLKLSRARREELDSSSAKEKLFRHLQDCRFVERPLELVAGEIEETPF